MKKFLSYVKNNIQLSVTVLAVASLLISNTYFIARAQEGDQSTSLKTEQSKIDDTELPLQKLAEIELNGTSESYPHLNCVQDIIRTTEPSDVYVSDVPYSLQFHGSSPTNSFQDVNGDNLPDYVYAYNTINGGINLYQNYMGCVYLNNGTGWDKVYQCYAVTETIVETGEITEAKYYGDCAGEPSAKTGSNNKQ